MKPAVTLQDKLIKQNEISRQRLAQELEKLDKGEKSDLRMIEAAKQRFHSRHKNLEPRQSSAGSNAINVRMYETHNPGFCYHCTGAIRKCGSAPKSNKVKDSYAFARSMIFTNDEVDPQKILCLHLLTAHTARWNNNDSSSVRPVALLLEKAKKKRFSGAWNNALTCYVVDTEEASVAATKNMKLHEDPRKKIQEDQAARDFQEKCRWYMGKNDDLDKALSSNARTTKIARQGLEKMPVITPHVYSLLGPSHELRIKQALAEGVYRRKLVGSSVERNSYSFHLDEDEDVLSRATTNESNRNWINGSTRSPSRRSTIGEARLDRRFTMLKSKRIRPSSWEPASRDMISVNSSFRPVKDVSSTTSSSKSPFRGVPGDRSSSSSFLSMNPEATNTFGKCVYLNAGSDEARRIVPILVNYQVQALVQTVLDVLERVNPEKSRIIVQTARDTNEIRRMLLRPEIQCFVQSLLGRSLMSSPESYVVSAAAAMNEIDVRFAGIPEKEIVALTLEMPSAPCLEALIAEIRNGIFHDAGKNARPNENAKEISSVEKVAKEDAVKSTVDAIRVAGRPEACDECNAMAGANRDGKRFSKIAAQTRRARNKGRGGSVDEDETDSVNEGKSKSSDHDVADAKSGRSLLVNSLTKTDEHRLSLGSDPAKRPANAKSWKAAQDPGHLDADHVILRRMTNTQRILVGQMCASLKSKRINNQGLINESVPLAALIAPVLSKDSIKLLTRGTTYSRANQPPMHQEEPEENVAAPDKITGVLLAKIRQDVAETETKIRLKRFLKREKDEEKRSGQ